MGKQRNIRLVLEYDGGAYHGWQIQPGVVTIQQVLEERVLRITQTAGRVVAAGRTDAGVHALGQVVHFHTPCALPVEAIQRGVNALLPPDIRVLRAEEMPWAFHARFSARGKRYEYRIWNGAVVSAFGYRHAWWISRPLDLEAMEAASQALCGVHDFSSFRSANCDGRHAVREVTGCGWVRRGDGLTFWIEANAYLKYMVRSIVGTLVEVGLGRRPADGMAGLMEARDRSAAGITAPARGLFLAEVMYPAPWGFNRRTGGDRAGHEREATPAAGDGVLGPAAGVGDGCMGVEPTGRALWEPIPAPAGGFLRGCPQRS